VIHDNFTCSWGACGYHLDVRTIAVIAMLFFSGYAGVARADQCAWVDEQVAARAVKEIERAGRVVELCEPCGDSVPRTPEAVASVTSHKVDAPRDWGGFEEVFVNGEPVDLAYVYVEVKGRLHNLAKLVGCPAWGVSPSLTLDGVPAGPVDENGAPVALPPAPRVAPDDTPAASSLTTPAARWLKPPTVKLSSLDPTQPPIDPAQPPIDSFAHMQRELSFGGSIGTVGVMQRSLSAIGPAITGGVRTRKLAVFADYRWLSIASTEVDAARRQVPVPEALHGGLHRLSAGVRYHVVAFDIPSRRGPRMRNFFELFVEGGAGAERIVWDGGGVLWRGDLAVGAGARIWGFQVYERNTVGLLVRALDVLARRDDRGAVPGCTGPCSTAGWDSGVLVSLSLVITG
jgi:hypothetical protein